MLGYAALGDSITYGLNASAADRAYHSRVVSMLAAKGVKAKRTVLARPGWTSADLAEALSVDPGRLRAASTVSVWIGGVDLIHAGVDALQGVGISVEARMHQYSRRLAAILQMIRTIGSFDVICCTQYNPYPNSPLAVQGVSMLNQEIQKQAERVGCRIAPVDQWFAGQEARLIDGYRSGTVEEVYRGITAVHPNEKGHAVIAAGLFPLVYAGMVRLQ
ncbi:SGNH/GDSL hydrolase family protein [Paenibacillus xerothermodurans]|uniref:SGNH/GDSL hydrolase family protein n=1 Tax=Paenibacillus xerothermodurans TaxID=1977292 RepID=A0A2W1NNA5_PAEXE|nr:SGNH/GDSL hydrolase family protein [Paenibacillus xerothermodurans]PZE20935.1 SGNH/GDSL hydrolase family protein [Paenibacillus xerothermodurans]